jgi:hypothetical protein
MSILQNIINSNVESISFYEENINLEFSNGATVNVFNNSSITPVNTELTGLTVTSVTESQDKIILEFDRCAYLTINLESQAYTGPEALVYTAPSGRMTVWS